LKNPAALDEVKNKLIDEPESIDRLPDPKDHKKDSDISRQLVLFSFIFSVNKKIKKCF
jgi:hypothetical protein|tara:strand:+ start:658 stop:831 length:174 start_codon:yes stop_codon:yes gene_type:complete